MTTTRVRLFHFKKNIACWIWTLSKFKLTKSLTDSYRETSQLMTISRSNFYYVFADLCNVEMLFFF